MISSIRISQQPGACGLVGMCLAFWVSDSLDGMNWLLVCSLARWLAGHGWDWTQVTPHTLEKQDLQKIAMVFVGGHRRARLRSTLKHFRACAES